MSYRILHLGKFYPPQNGGMETHLRDLATRQARIFEVKVIVANNTATHAVADIEGVHIERLPKVATIASMPVCPHLLKAIRNSPADLVHIHMPNPGAALAFLLSGHTGKLVLTHHADTIGRRLLRRLSDPFVNQLMSKSERIIVTSARYLSSSEELRPFHDKCEIIPLGIDLKSLQCVDQARSRELRQKFGDRLVLAAGRLVPYKGFDTLVRAMKHVDGTLLLVGTGSQNAALSRLIASEGVADRVNLLGRVDDLSQYFAAASVFVLPSINRAEAFGLVQLEAMAAGLPVVNTDIDSGVPEVCIHGETGLTVPPRNAAALADAVTTILDRAKLRHELGQAAKARVNAKYTADLMVARTLSLYEEVLSSSTSGKIASSIH